MLTIGLVKEIFFLAKVTNQDYTVQIYPSNLQTSPKILTVKISPAGLMDVYYHDKHIWRETVEGAVSFFGIESCDSIYKIITAIDSNDESWREKFIYNESEI